MFFLLAVGITLFIGLLQIGLIRPYYRNSKIHDVSIVADVIGKDVISDGTPAGISDAMQETVDNNVCVIMYNDEGRTVYVSDSLGSGCVFNTASFSHNKSIGNIKALKKTLRTNGGSASVNLTNDTTEQDMIVYARKIRADLSDYYLLVNSPLEPVDSVVSFFTTQYFFYMVIAIIIASLVAFYISKQITGPIVRMKHEAVKLSHADYSAKFDGGSFTETRELADTLNKADEKLGKIEQLRRDLIANISHDIRTPLTDIRAYAEMIRDISGDNPEKREKHLNVIIRETEYMNQLVNDMSELSRMQSGNETLHMENLDLAEKIREIVEMDQPLIDKANLKLVMNVPDELTVYADEVKIGQVIANYLSNAIKHTPSGKRIYINAFYLEDEETVRIEVADEGEGIPADELPYIWDRYQKSSRTFRRDMSSTGLGLAIVRAIADSMHARCGVQTQVGKGSTFWFELTETHEA